MRRGQTKPFTDEQAKKYIDKLVIKDNKQNQQSESFSKLSTEHKLLFAKLETLAEKTKRLKQLGHLIKPDEMLNLTQEIKAAFLCHISNIKAKLERKENVDEDLKLLYFFSLATDTFIGNLLITNQFRETILFAKIIRKRYLELKEITDQGISEGLITDDYVKTRPFVRLVDLNGCIARSHMELGQTEESLNCIDEALDTIASHNINTENTPRARNYLYRMAAIQFWKLNEVDKTWSCLDYTLKNNPEWRTDIQLLKCLCDYVAALSKNNLDGAMILMHKMLVEIPEWYRNENIVNCAGECIRSLLATKQDEDARIAKDLCILLRKANKQTNFVNQCLSIIDKRALRVANQKSNEVDRLSKRFITPANILPLAMDTVEPNKPKLVHENDCVEDKDALTSPKNKQKTRGPVLTEDKNEVTADPVPDAVRYGFSGTFVNETIYPLRSDLIPEGTYYAIYPQSNMTAYPDLGQTHEKIKAILKEGKIGASGNRVRYLNKKDAFKVGNKHSNDRFFSRIGEDVVVNGKRRVLLLFTEKHTHNTQHKEYEMKTPTVRKAK